MKFRIFEYQSNTSSYKMYRTDGPDVNISPHDFKMNPFDAAAVKWANDNYKGPANKIHVLVARMSPHVEEIKPITLTRTTPWEAQNSVMVIPSLRGQDTCTGEPDEDDDEF